VLRTLEGANHVREANPQKVQLCTAVAIIRAYWPDFQLSDFGLPAEQFLIAKVRVNGYLDVPPFKAKWVPAKKNVRKTVHTRAKDLRNLRMWSVVYIMNEHWPSFGIRDFGFKRTRLVMSRVRENGHLEVPPFESQRST